MINDAVLIGRLTKAVDVRYTQGGTAVGNFTLAVNRNFKNAAGEREADFISCVIWKKSAENLANFTHKGTLISVRGRINTRHYDKDAVGYTSLRLWWTSSHYWNHVTHPQRHHKRRLRMRSQNRHLRKKQLTHWLPVSQLISATMICHFRRQTDEHQQENQ